MLKHLLWPLALLYGFAVKLRNALFNIGILKSVYFSKTICVGNLTVGGTGKTPLTEHLIKLIKPTSKVATLSRGYKRKTKGFILANERCNASTIGDEPYQIFSKFSDITVAVDENRVRGINTLRDINPQLDTIILDDAFQHRYVKAGLNILLTDYSNLIYSDFFLPVGRLRDSFSERKRADMVVVTKCPHNLSIEKQSEIKSKLRLKQNQEIYFSAIQYGNIQPIFNNSGASNLSLSPNLTVVAVAGIANPKPFFNYLSQHANCNDTLPLTDHFNFTEKKIRTIFEQFSQIQHESKAIITTEKDASRLRGFSDLPNEIKGYFYYLPIEVVFLGTSNEEFNHKIQSYVRENKADKSLH
ncbi:MAG: tetraacyldisaccharide 4'-kinase [Bacteroidales bacterium]|nr:tetraacyldisaccharide 4'-kinase [Bacteroidales bacterium]MDD4384724.1 tetraacyldisaccharide 4'-kinase [Bacteroidales bacterium]MDY0196581.1 tetraacyldisaccharide 4'-kinase [Tenuifilaceae bacterium]